MPAPANWGFWPEAAANAAVTAMIRGSDEGSTLSAATSRVPSATVTVEFATEALVMFGEPCVPSKLMATPAPIPTAPP